MPKKVTIEQVGQIIKHLQEGATGRQAAKLAKVHLVTAKKIYGHVARVGHYKTIRVEAALPPWKDGRRSYAGPTGKLNPALEAALSRLGSATVTEIVQSMEAHGFTTSRQMAYFILTGLYRKGRVRREGRPYVFTLSPETFASK
jgi:hypothetical protein